MECQAFHVCDIFRFQLYDLISSGSRCEILGVDHYCITRVLARIEKVPAQNLDLNLAKIRNLIM